MKRFFLLRQVSPKEYYMVERYHDKKGGRWGQYLTKNEGMVDWRRDSKNFYFKSPRETISVLKIIFNRLIKARKSEVDINDNVLYCFTEKE